MHFSNTKVKVNKLTLLIENHYISTSQVDCMRSAQTGH